ncbi:MAG: FmdB family transcriptional regulator [Deltaproteobacteria bacterium]|nr:FmdB family transcriptional regulator [Deltaproteobacteria bacterium]MBU52904.1 FmdB family transcriptional regulator [Deltaproteobacteria bacterium]
MPIYEYQCEQCGAVIERIQSASAAAPDKCPECQGGPLHKLMSQSSFVLKGGGWYKDGYSGPSNTSKSSPSSGSSSSSSSTSTSSTSSDTSSSSASSSSTSSSSTSSSD